MITCVRESLVAITPDRTVVYEALSVPVADIGAAHGIRHALLASEMVAAFGPAVAEMGTHLHSQPGQNVHMQVVLSVARVALCVCLRLL